MPYEKCPRCRRPMNENDFMCIKCQQNYLIVNNQYTNNINLDQKYFEQMYMNYTIPSISGLYYLGCL